MGTAVFALVLGFTAVGWTQGMRGGMGRAPRLLGEFKPVVGSGAQYRMTAQNGTMSFAYVIVGQENVEGSTGYWMETRSENPGVGGEMVMKQLMVTGGDKPQIKRMIMQTPGRPPMEMPMGMMGGMGQRGQGPGRGPGQGPGQGDSTPGEKVGTETITVPAGIFECVHYRKQEPRGTVDVWISDKVPPYGMVKMSSTEMTMVLEKVLTNETSHIQGEPQKMDMPFPRQ
jgi:hypothetical protein